MSCSGSKEKKIKRFTGTVPEDMVTNILLRLDAKTLVGFKSVSKTWLALISSTHFAKSHLAITSAEEKQEEIHIVHTYDNNPDPWNSVSFINIGTRQLITTFKFPKNKCSFMFVGSACGIVCISDTSGEVSKVCKYYLWNPATSFSKLVPSLPIDDSEAVCVGGFGFGFDEIDNDFKIVRVLWRMRHNGEYFDHSPRNCDKVYVDVYSSKRNVWRKVEQEGMTIDDICYDMCRFDVTVGGRFLCCVGCYGIIIFDLHTEVLNSPGINYPVPTFEAKSNNFSKLEANARITNFNDSLAIIFYKQIGYDHSSGIPINNQKDYKLNLWVLDDKACLHGGGVQASWTLIYDIDVKLPLEGVHGYLNTGDLLRLLYGEDWCLYNPDKKEPRYVIQKFFFGEVFNYTKSLFTIPGFKKVNIIAPPTEADKNQLDCSTS